MAHNYYFEHRQIPRIKPLIVDRENVFQILIPWGTQNRALERAQKLFEVLNMTLDADATQIKAGEDIAETPRGKLLKAIQVMNTQIQKENSPQLSNSEAYEWLVVMRTKKTWIWAMTGGFYLKCGIQEANMNSAIKSRDILTPELPHDLVGLEGQCFVSTGCFYHDQLSPIIVAKKTQKESLQEEQFLKIKDELIYREANSSFWVAEVSEIQETHF